MSSQPIRCPWVTNDQIYIDYHDNEWGRDLRGQRQLYEKITLEGFQAGLSWLTILKKREAFRLAFQGFDLEAVASFDDSKVEALMGDAGIIRNRAKILTAISNAKIILEKDLDLTELLWSFAPKNPSVGAASATTSTESDALSKELKKHGFKFVGSTTMHALMQSTGMVKSHAPDCFLAD